ncbi:leucine-rich repeat and WD repeat-containing protein 1 [Megalops cyprinoides]|uniref:leucine-rich repeat and WD repeat-containing protein 1 n=1 Tax=Megalops cyprinoides TaxID=118141 RepID=UPI0018643BC6|nr:leucine-rich repeat and WD repeat-containing protein 1 [Megalops cyprinoides]
MAKITEKLLLEKGIPKARRLEDIRTLTLSRMGLSSKDLPVSLLSRLRSLEELDLSGNRLQQLPPGLCLPSLRILNCSDNEMEDVTSLEPLSALEDLRLDDNVYLTVSDEYKVMFLLSNLKVFNGKVITSSANHIRYVATENLQKRVVALWEGSFTLPDPLTPEKLKKVEKEFVAAACSQIKYGPNSLSDYTKWRLESIAKKHLQSLIGRGEEEHMLENSEDTKNNAIRSSAKRAVPDTDAGRANGSPQKRARMVGTAPAEASPRKSTRQLSTPVKVEQHPSSPRKGGQAVGSPNGKQSKAESVRKSLRDTLKEVPPLEKQTRTPSKAPSSGKQTRTPTKAAPHERKAVNGTPQKITSSKSKDPVCLRPLHVLQCHSKQDSPDDFSTQLWACAFEPPLDAHDPAGQTSRTVATCGGESVCIIDCETGHVLKKYKVSGEEFFSLAWSSIPMSREGGGMRWCSILAAGGKKGVVKLIHPRANIAYGQFRASRRAISTLKFSPSQQSFLFTGAYDNKVVMWDIGGVDSDYNFKVSQLLVLETRSTPLHLCLPPSSRETQHLLVACDKGLLCFNTQLSKTTLKRTPEMEITFPVYEKEDEDNHYRTIDGLGFLTDDIVVSKSHMQGSIYLWSWSRTRASRPNKKQEVSAVILAELQWSSTDLPYLSLSTCPGEGYVVCGDEKGGLWTYHLTDILESGAKKGDAISPTEVLEWPSPVRKGQGPVEGPSINSVAMDPELRYLVALSDKNMAMVWRRM